jgi:hypothetical protein
MGHSVYHNGEIDISPELRDEHATLLEEALTKSNPALLGNDGRDSETGRSSWVQCFDWMPKLRMPLTK